MKVDIWSDVRCPFCYIGKHKFEKALNDFEHKDKIEIEWHSFELDRDLITDTSLSALDYFVKNKGVGVEQAKEMTSYVTNIAKEIGITINSEKSIVANSHNAHRIIQLAKTKGLANEIEELLFKAHFEEGKNIDDFATLTNVAIQAGLKEKEVNELLNSEEFSNEVKADEARAQQIGIQGVPFFIFNNKYAVSGAQQPESFLQALKQSWTEFEVSEKPIVLNNGHSCDLDGNCD